MSHTTKLIDQHIAFCAANDYPISQTDINRLYQIPYKFLKGVVAQQQQDILHLRATQADLQAALDEVQL